MTIETLSSEADVRAAGNFSERVSGACINFYRELTSFLLIEMIGQDNYDACKQSGGQSDAVKNRVLKAEALMTVGLALPAVSAPTTQAGTLQSFNIGRTVDIEVKSVTKEIMDMAATFISLGRSLIPVELFDEEGEKAVWYQVYQRVFPSLSETPTVADLHSEAEAVIKVARGDVDHEDYEG